MIYRICHCVTAQCGRREPLLARRADKRMRTHTRAPVHHQAEIADASSDLKYVLKRCDPFLHAKSVCPQKRPSPRTRMRAHAHMRARLRTYEPKMGSFGLQQNERTRGRGQRRARKWFDETKRWSAQLQIRFSAKWQMCPLVMAISPFESR